MFLAFITREEKIHCLTMLGHDASKLRHQAQTTRQMKAQGGRIPKPKDNVAQNGTEKGVEEPVPNEPNTDGATHENQEAQ